MPSIPSDHAHWNGMPTDRFPCTACTRSIVQVSAPAGPSSRLPGTAAP